MEQYVIKGGNPLVGEVEIGGAKNAALAILSAAIMTDETILIENLPDLQSRSTDLQLQISVLIMNILKKSVHPIIFWVHYLVNTSMQKYHFLADATSEVVRSTSISKDSVHLVHM